MTTRTETVIAEGFTLSRMVWRLFGRLPEGYVERLLELNPGLADLGEYLPVGTKIVFPLDQVTSDQASRPVVVRLWD